MDAAAIAVSDVLSPREEPATSGSGAPLRHGPVAVLLHWSIAVLILADFGLALYFDHPGDSSSGQIAYQWHMSIGMCVLVLSVLRVAWRLMHSYPMPPPDMHIALRIAARASHALLYLFMLAVPLTGWVVMSLRRQSAGLLDLFDWPAIPYILTHTTRAQRVQIYRFALPSHSTLAWAGIGLVGLHIAAALYHHIHRRDEVLVRMFPGMRAPRARSPDAAGEAG